MSSPPKILIVDDELFNVDYLEQELGDLGYKTVSASNGQEALEQVEAASPDVILLDVLMPIMDGFPVCRILKSNDETRLIPIVIMTALDGLGPQQWLHKGACDLLADDMDAGGVVCPHLGQKGGVRDGDLGTSPWPEARNVPCQQTQ